MSSPKSSGICQFIRRLLQLAGILFIVQVTVAITGLPPSLIRWMKALDCPPQSHPRYVIVLGGGGVPSGSTLMRTYYAAQFGAGLTGTTFVVSLPADEDPEHNSVGRMRDELVLRGIAATNILMETRGLNTHEQAVNVAQLLGSSALEEPIVIVTSDYHSRRAVLMFRKTGFTNVASLNAASIGAEADPGAWAQLRYGIWNNLEAQLKMLRELLALLASRMRGWI